MTGLETKIKIDSTSENKQSFAWYDGEKLDLREKLVKLKAVRQTLKIDYVNLFHKSFLKTKRVKKSNREDDFGRRGD